MWRCNLGLGVKVGKAIPIAWGDDCSRCHLPTVLGYKHYRGKKKLLLSLECLEGNLLCASKVGQNGKIVLTFLSSHNLDLQRSHFKMTTIHNFEVVMHDSENNLNPMTWLWCKITVSPTLNQKLSKYVKLPKITTVQVLSFVKTSAHLALSALWKTGCETGSSCIWIFAVNFITSNFLHSITLLTIRPLPSGKAKPTIVSMHSYKQIHGSSLGFFENFAPAKESWVTDKDVANFWNINYPFCNLMLLHKFLFSYFSCSHCTSRFIFYLFFFSF